MGASRIGAMVAEEVQNQQMQDKYVTYHMTEKNTILWLVESKPIDRWYLIFTTVQVNG